jgi:hypothetical protein
MTVSDGSNLTLSVAGDDFVPVVQFSFSLDFSAGSPDFVLKPLNARAVSILALSFLENSESTIVRCVVNYPDVARKVFSEKSVFFYETHVLAIEINSVDEIFSVWSAISAAEMKINYMYPFLERPGGRIGLIIQTENNSFTDGVLRHVGIKIISQNDIWR